ncbi:MAG: glycosyltransferase family 2 protein [Sphingobacteriales bacterium]|nr:glycosyltransferase family 2 protein [Sphingobacteriales bacterium]
MIQSCHYEQVALLITHYNRSKSLHRLLDTFKTMNTSFKEIIVSDDGSTEKCINELKELQNIYGFKLITAPKNSGLGNNINKGQRAVTSPFTLYVQEDFVPLEGFNTNFQPCLKVMEEDKSIDIIRFYAYFKHPYTKKYNRILNEMKFDISLFKPNHLKFYVYSDHPHLRRNNFIEKFGNYKEGFDVNITEFDMCLSFLKRKGKGLLMNDFKAMFDQFNSAEEPSTVNRQVWKERKSFLIFALRAVYLKFRLVKNSIQLMRYKI